MFTVLSGSFVPIYSSELHIENRVAYCLLFFRLDSCIAWFCIGSTRDGMSLPYVAEVLSPRGFWRGMRLPNAGAGGAGVLRYGRL